MTIWTPRLQGDGPRYVRLTAALEADVARGALPPGTRLPTQRALARSLGLGIATVTRAYGEAERRGLISSEVGRGTFVRASATTSDELTADLRGNYLLPWPLMEELGARLGATLADSPGESWMSYDAAGGAPADREGALLAAAAVGVPATLGQVMLTAGAQHAIAIVLATLLAPGEVLLVEELTYTGIKAIAGLLRLRLRPVALDEEGLRPDALAAACRDGDAAALYCQPVLQNPTGAVMSAQRRDRIASVAASAGLRVIEDDTYGFLLPEAPRLAAVLPEAIWLTGLSKSLFPALRIGYLRAPTELVPRLELALGATLYQTSPLLARAASRWLDDGTAERVARWKREEIEARQRAAAVALGALAPAAHPRCPHLWLPLPDSWSPAAAAAAAARERVLVMPAAAYAVEREEPRAVRVCLGPPRTSNVLEAALGRLAGMLAHAPAPPSVMA